jgi:hypothetical protein
MHTRHPEPQVWGGWGPTPNCPSASWYLDDGVSTRVAYISSYKLESAGSLRAETSMHHAAKSTSHNADITPPASEFARAVRPRPPARGRQPSGQRPGPHASRAPPCRAALARTREGGGLGTRIISGLHRIIPIVIRLTCSAVGRKPAQNVVARHAPPSASTAGATPSASTAGATPSASTAGAPPSASTAGTAPRVLLRHWTLPATASGHAFGSRTPCAYIRTCTRVRVHPLYSHPRPQPHAPAYGMVPRSRPRSSKLVGGQQGMHHGGAGRRPN